MMNDELNLLRLSKIKRERNEISLLKNKYDLFNKNRFSLNDIQRKRYNRNIKSIRKLIKLVNLNFKIPFHIYVNNIKKERILYSKNIILIKKICEKNNIPEDLKLIIISFL